MIAFYLVVFSVIIILSTIINKISVRLGVPVLIAFIFLGMVFGVDGIFKIDFSDYRLTEQVATIGLVIIMFYGGFSTRWKLAKKVFKPSVVLSSVGVVLTTFLVAFFGYFVLGLDFVVALLLGSVVGSTDAASVFSILRSKKLNLKYNTASLLELESGSNDPFAYMLTIITLSILGGSFSVGSVIYTLFSQIVYGIIIGIVISIFAMYIINRSNVLGSGHELSFMLAIAMLSYGLPSLVGGNGFLSVYIVGIILGNKKIRNKKQIVIFFDGLTNTVQMLLFFILGLLATPSQFTDVIIPAILVALFITFIARPLVVFILLKPFKAPTNQILLVSWAGFRGAASIVFATMAYIMNKVMTAELFNIVFCVVLISILLQGSLLPMISKRLSMIDDKEDVLKTFNDYSDNEPIEFIRLDVTVGHKWENQRIRDINLIPNFLLVLIVRGNEKLIPNGNTIIKRGDMVVIAAPTYSSDIEMKLREVTITKGHELNGLLISELPTKESLIILIKRNDKTVIPNGRFKLKERDTLVFYQPE